MFNKLQKKQAVIYTSIFFLFALLIILISYYSIWSLIIENEKEELNRLALHEANEYYTEGEMPVSNSDVESGSLLAYIEFKNNSIDLLTKFDAGNSLLRQKEYWPTLDEKKITLFRIKENGKRYRYLAVSVPIMNKNGDIGTLYMFKSIEFYYRAAIKSIEILAAFCFILLGCTIVLGYWVSGKTIQPIRENYERQRDLAMAISHEIRTPLSVMQLAIELIECELSFLSDSGKKAVEMINGEILYLTTMVEKLLETIRTKNNMKQIMVRPINLYTFYEDILGHFKLLANQKGIQMFSNISCEEEEVFDENVIRQVLYILLDNAIKYTMENGEIILGARKEKKKLILFVQDSGEGISEEEKEKIFSLFYRIEKSRNRKLNSFGIGLYWARELVESHGGLLKVTDILPHGAMFEIILPESK